MNIVYIFPNDIKSKAMPIIENDKYDKVSFGRMGYVVKDGEDFGFPGKTLVVVRNVDIEFKEHASKLFSGISQVETLENEKCSQIVKRVNEEEERAQSGFGSIFG
ncbi:MAG: hypothetical protein ACP5H8_01610 [Candidatus Micrarchaeia archaeon]